jgi:hypothetical protein
MPEDCSRDLPDERLIVRNIKPDEAYADGRINKRAFIPRKNGKDDNGLSASQPGDDGLDGLKARTRNANGLYAKFSAGQCRSTSACGITLDACPAPREWDPLHVLVTGMPTDRQQRLVFERLAELMAEKCEVHPPRERVVALVR